MRSGCRSGSGLAPRSRRRANRRSRLLHVGCDLPDEVTLARKRLLVAKVLPQLDDEPLTVEVALEIEEVHLHAPFHAAVVRIHSDRHGRATAARRAGIDAMPRHEQLGRNVEVRGREAERSPALVAEGHLPLDLRRSPEQDRRGGDLPDAGEPEDLRRRHTGDEWYRVDGESQPLEKSGVAGRPPAEPKVLADGDRPCADAMQDGVCELLRLEAGERLRELEDEHLVDPALFGELQAHRQRRQELDAIPEHDPRGGPEGDHGHGRSCRLRRVEDTPMAQVDAVEAPDRDRTFPGTQLGRIVGDVHSRASASSGGMSRSGSASSTENGPISVRRNDRQWPPRASATARTYVPELTRRSSRATPLL